jgi:hypothetical protein
MRILAKAAALYLAIYVAAAGFSSAQIRLPNAGINMPPPAPEERPDKKGAAKTVLTLEELSGADVRFHRELDAVDASIQSQKFSDADDQLTKLLAEIDDLLKRIAVTPIQKGSMELDGVSEPANQETETAYFTHLREKAASEKAMSGVLAPIAALQKQAMDALVANHFIEARDAFRKSSDQLTANKAQIPPAIYEEYAARSDSGAKASVTSYWSSEYARLRDKYNTSTADGLSQDDVRRIIKSVADEIVSRGYNDPSKNPDMPSDPRSLFQTLLTTANQYLSQ